MELEKITLHLPSEILPFVSKKRKEISSRILEFLVLELYRLGEISGGKAAQYLEMERFEFIKFASRLGIPFIDLEKGELQEDLEAAHGLIKKGKK
jgi:predicted HTH domain antitoxin